MSLKVSKADWQRIIDRIRKLEQRIERLFELEKDPAK